MRPLFLLLLLAFSLPTYLLAQAPENFNYQAVLRDNQGNIITNQEVTLRFSIIESSDCDGDGTTKYRENHFDVLPTDLGTVVLRIGEGFPDVGSFSDIDWASNCHFLQSEIKLQGTNDFIALGVQQFNSVPYALHAKTVENSNDADPFPTNEIQELEFDSSTNQLSLSQSNTVDLSSLSGGSGSDNQEISFNEIDLTLTIEDGNTVDLSALQDGFIDGDTSDMNEIQELEFDANTNQLALSQSNTVDLSSLSGGSGNDNQEISFNEIDLTLTIENGNTVDLSALQDGFIDGDASDLNEIQELEFDSNTNQLTLSQSNTVDLSSLSGGSGSDNQEISFNETDLTLTIEDGNTVDLSALQDGFIDGDASDTNELQTISKSGNTVTLSNNGGSFTDETFDGDGDDTNELQTISKSGNTVTLSNNGGSFTDETFDGDGDDTNELQTISKSGNTVTLSNNGGSFTDETFDGDGDDTNELQSLQLNGTLLSLSPNQGGNMVNLKGVSSLWNENNSGIDYDGGRVGIGINPSTPEAALEIINGGGSGNDVPTLIVRKQGGINSIAEFKDDNVNRMVITREGNIGMGTSNPTARLEIVRDNNQNDVPALTVEASSGNQAIAVFKDSNTERMRVYRSGVGIGTPTTPAYNTQGSLEIESGGNGIPALTVHKEGGGDDEKIVLFSAGTNNNTGLLDETFTVLRNGLTKVRKFEIIGGSDFSEYFEIKNYSELGKPKPGMVVSIDPNNPGELMISSNSYDKKIAGIISGANGIETGMTMGQKGSVASGKYPIALSGRVYVYADAKYGSIQPGDMLTSSKTPGFAQKARNSKKSRGAILGKAMTELKEGKGYVLVLVNLQ